LHSSRATAPPRQPNQVRGSNRVADDVDAVDSIYDDPYIDPYDDPMSSLLASVDDSAAIPHRVE
jgi:hypothetical protein